jgi:hypothetical protein
LAVLGREGLQITLETVCSLIGRCHSFVGVVDVGE